MFTWDDPTIPSNAQMAFARKIQSVTGWKLPDDMTRQSLREYITKHMAEFKTMRPFHCSSRFQDSPEWDVDTFAAEWEEWDRMEADGLDPYTGGFAVD